MAVANVCFQPFFNFVDMRALLENFCVYHVNAPGQEDGAPSLPEEFPYILKEIFALLATTQTYIHTEVSMYKGSYIAYGSHCGYLKHAFQTHSSAVDIPDMINPQTNSVKVGGRVPRLHGFMLPKFIVLISAKIVKQFSSDPVAYYE
ncbi:hypothetical protein SFRURICE_013897 [Spodoptera frugiperda]|uniref:SFRICE_020182 n=1 Tax=Spodoptera frugiperda TaxID=7108 RepID=A0A2H1VVF2_SPOFR|nr:hypothetical protein SFRURICE_013897 [Spodoptera frugiperda]